MPSSTFFALRAERRDRLVDEAIREFSEHSFAEASLSQIAVRARVAKGSLYQYFEDKLDLYRWLLTEEVPRRKREFLAQGEPARDFWAGLHTHIERGMAFLVEHPRLARITAAAAQPAADEQVRGLHQAVCASGLAELRSVLERGLADGALARGQNLDVVTHFVSAIIGPGLTAAVLSELDAELHEVLASDDLRRRLGPRRRQRLAREAVQMIRGGLACRA
jgi:AcrR family transcriptional regulator